MKNKEELENFVVELIEELAREEQAYIDDNCWGKTAIRASKRVEERKEERLNKLKSLLS